MSDINRAAKLNLTTRTISKTAVTAALQQGLLLMMQLAGYF